MIKKIFRSVVVLVITSNYLLAQHGLENIIVEKYYVSSAKDTGALGSYLPVGSVTYRIYVDMLPGFRFQAAYGVPNHELRIATTTLFFNNIEYGGTVANVIPDRNLGDNTVMLDSWLSAGGASEGNLGILKSKDNGVGNIINSKGFLQNSDRTAGIPLTKQDGLITGTPPQVTGFGIESEIGVFKNKTVGSLFSTNNGSWATMYGSVGPDSIDNKVLIAQITTDGIFSFELNIQIGTPYGGAQQYVARNPSGDETQLKSLTYSSAVIGNSKKSSTKK